MASERSTVVPVEFAGIDYAVNETPSGQLTIKFEGHPIPSLPGIRYGLALSHGTSLAQAEQLAAMLQQHAPFLFAGFLDRVDDEKWQSYLSQLYDDIGYFDPSRPLGPGDEIAAPANGGPTNFGT
jgi:hypothetical protein